MSTEETPITPTVSPLPILPNVLSPEMLIIGTSFRKLIYILLFIATIICIFGLIYVWWPRHHHSDAIFRFGLTALIIIIFIAIVYFAFW